MIRAKELEKRLPRGMLRREAGKKGRYQLVLRNLDAETVLLLVDPLWEVFGGAKHAKAEVREDGVVYGVHVLGRSALGYRNGTAIAEGRFSWRDGRLELYHSRREGQSPLPDCATRALERQIRRMLQWRGE